MRVKSKSPAHTLAGAFAKPALTPALNLGFIRDECRLRVELSYILPIRLVSVMAVYRVTEFGIGHVWPIVLVESRSFLQHGFINIENEL